MKKQATLVALLGLWAWAGACSPPVPVGPNTAWLKLNNAYDSAKSADQSACKGYLTVNCTAFNRPAREMAPIIWQVQGGPSPDREPLKEVRGSWVFTASIRYGRTTTIMNTAGGSLAVTTDLNTAYEQLYERLRATSDWRFLWRNCTLAGLTWNMPFKAQRCHWVAPAEGSQRTFEFEVTQSSDRSLPPGVYSWYPPDGASCWGGIPFRIGPPTRS